MKRDLAQLVFFIGWFVVLYRYRPLRELIRAAPRQLTLAIAVFLAAWLVAQVTDQRRQFFPIYSVYMYGEHEPAPEVVGVAVAGRHCDGTGERLDLEFMGRARIRSRLQIMYIGLSYVRTAADSAARQDRIDRTLESIGRIYNRTYPEQPLCAIGLDEIRIPADQYESGIIPPPRLVHEIPLR